MTVQDFVKTMKMAPSSTQGKMVQQIVEAIAGEHRTHQASIIRNLQHILVAYSSINPGSDPRNEQAVAFADNVACIDISIPYI
ncbi:MAG: hypothetical protein D4S01_11435 [Dehalococcoidia bacterium]|nr:MAG: hypothetical protein D4S01_11435 [Dehalococcoidia bacterium]